MFSEFNTLMIIKKYSPNTIEAYIELVQSFQHYLSDKLQFIN